MRKSIYLNPTTAAILGAADEPNLSGRIAEIVASWAMACDNGGLERAELDSLPSAMVRYRALLDSACPSMAVNEWALLCDVLNSTHRLAWHFDNDPARAMALSVADSGPDGMAQKWQIDLAAFAARLDAMPYAAQCAVMEVVSRFWARAGNSLDPMEQQLRAAGARVAE